jgi:amyloid beta precursor protein binding protein 1
VETHPESLIDLRVHSPFPALIDYAKTFEYSTMDNAEHGHVPAVVILVKALEEWRAAVSSFRGGGCATTGKADEG